MPEKTNDRAVLTLHRLKVYEFTPVTKHIAHCGIYSVVNSLPRKWDSMDFVRAGLGI